MPETVKLSELEIGNTAYITEINAEEEVRRRLQALGMINGTAVACVRKSPLGDPAAYLVRGAVIALRQSDSSRVAIECREVR